MIFLLIDTEFDLKTSLWVLNPENHQVFSIHIVFQYQSKIIRVIELKNLLTFCL